MRPRSSRVLFAVVGLSVLASGCTSASPPDRAALAGSERSAAAGADRSAASTAAFGKLPMRFEPNQGQAGTAAGFVARGPGYTALLGPTELTLSTKGSKGSDPVRMRLQGGDAGSVARHGPRLSGVSNYLTGKDPSA